MLESCDAVEQGGQLRIGALGARFTALRVSHRVLGRLEQGKQLGQEEGDIAGILHKLGHVLHNAGTGTPDGSNALNKAADKHRRDHRQRRAINLLDEDSRGQLVHHLGALLGKLNGLHQTGDEGLDVRVGAARAQEEESLLGGTADLLHEIVNVVQ
jgi:hypothetical protein